MYKVFYNDKFLLISYKNIKCIDCLRIKFIDNVFINIFLNENIKENYIIISEDIENEIFILKKYFKYILAAGGLVVNNNNQLLLIKHYNVWDLPKGKVEKNENLESAAIREVSEECGINNMKIAKKIDDTFHIYSFKNKYHLKHSVWFLMYYNDNETLKPQILEDISEAKWVNLNDIDKYFSNMYNSIKCLINSYLSR
jgi:ADP-ribose pyrophosphatase YjhB (NUDIX family)